MSDIKCGLCKDCKYWGKTDPLYYGDPQSVRACHRTPHLRSSMISGGDTDIVIEQDYQEITAFVQDASDYSATLFTKEDHGCVQFKGMAGE